MTHLSEILSYILVGVCCLAIGIVIGVFCFGSHKIDLVKNDYGLIPGNFTIVYTDKVKTLIENEKQERLLVSTKVIARRVPGSMRAGTAFQLERDTDD